MATTSTFYLNAPSLGSATAVFLDSNLTNCAPNGFYSDGVIAREQVDCVLLPQQTCPSPCPAPCELLVGATGGIGVYQININSGSSTGAIVLWFDPYYVPDGIRVTYDGIIYNKLSGGGGVHQSSNAGHFTFVGRVSDDCGIVTTHPSVVEYLYDEITASFIPTGATQSITVSSGDLSLTAGGGPGHCYMVIPKTAATPSNLFIEIFGPCATAWDFNISCPAALPSFPSSNMFATNSITCITAMPNTYYFVKVHTAIDTYVGINDYVFTDANGQYPLSNGYYLTSNAGITNKVIQVVNGIIIAISNCI